ncbi:MAG: DUF2339 domain-containing protein [Burkholderiales bacterium]|nr:DUF2339 domain-containing protein [Burkholderiales bacterium]
MQTVIAVVIGALLGGAWGHEANVLFGALLGWLLVRVLGLQRELAALRQAQAQGQPCAAPAPVVAPAASTGVATPVPTGATPEAPVAEPPGAGPQAPAAAPATTGWVFEDRGVPVPDAAAPITALPVAPAEPAPPPAAPAAPAAPGPDRLAALRAWLLGGNTIAKAGVGILFIGLAFLAKYASEHVSLPVELRLAGVAGVALVLLVLGWRLRTRRAAYAQVLQGGAVAVLYLTLFVGFRFYGVLGIGPVFGLMVAVAALAAALAVLQEAPALAVIGALGGFATPLLVSTGSGDHVALFSYYLVLDLGIAAVAWFRTWRVLNLVGFVCTFVIASAWGVLQYRPEHFASSEAFLVAYFLLFVAVLLLPVRRVAPEGPRALWVNGSLLFGLPTIGFALQYGLVQHTEYGVALSALVLAAFYVALAAWLRRRPGLALVFEASLAIGTVFLTLVIPFALDARSTAGAWALEGAGLVWLGLHQARRLPRAAGYLLQGLAGAAMLVGHQHAGPPAAFWNATVFNTLLAALGALTAALAVQRHAARVAPREAVAEPLLIGWATLWLLGGAALQIDGFVPARQGLAAWVAVLSVIAGVYALLSSRLVWPRVALPALGHAPLMMLAVPLSALLQTNPLHHGGWWAWPLAVLAHGLVLRHAVPGWPGPGRRLAHALGALVVAGLAALLGRALTANWGDDASAWPWLGWLAGPALLLFVLMRPGAASRWPLRADPPAYRQWATGVLALAGLLWALLANIGSDGSARPLPHLPLLNPLDLGLAIALVSAWAWWRSEAADPLRRAQPATGPALVGGMAFLWVSAMLVRAFHHWGGVPYRIDRWFDSLPVQTGLTLLWTAMALGLMWLAARRAMRAPWITGAALLGVVVLKLLLVDLSGSGTVTRIVSFIGVGVLMLVIGYVAPLPAAKEKQHAN